jgi:hypothetical protein
LKGNAYVISFSGNICALTNYVSSIGYHAIPMRAFSPPANYAYDDMLYFCLGYELKPSAHNLSINQLSRICSHRGVWDIISSDPGMKPDDWSLILEEDVAIQKTSTSSRELVHSALSLPANIQKGFVYLGICKDNMCSHAYAITKAFASKMHSALFCGGGLCRIMTLEVALKAYFHINERQPEVGNKILYSMGLFQRINHHNMGFDSLSNNMSVAFHTCYRHKWGGRLGNLLFKYASLVGICIKNNMHPYSCAEMTPNILAIDDFGRPIKKFANLFNIPHTSCPANCRTYKEHAHSRYGIFYDPDVFQRAGDGGSEVNGNLQITKYFYPHAEAAIRKLFTFPPAIKKEADLYFTGLRNQLPNNNTVFTCVHIRREDKIGHERYNAWALSEEYYNKAISKFMTRSNNTALVYFVGGSANDESWVRSNIVYRFPSHQHFFTFELSDVVSLYALSTCDNIVMGASSFSWWSAFLSGHSNIIAPETIQVDFVKEDHYMPMWTTIGPTS